MSGAVSSYFASVGVQVDKSSFAQVDRYFDRLESRFQKLGRTTNAFAVQLRFNIDRARAQTQIQQDLARISRNLTLRINNFAINNRALTNLINQSLSSRTGAPRIRLNVALSNASLQNMRTQVMAALNGLIISPRINPRGLNQPGQGGSGGGSGNRPRNAPRGNTNPNAAFSTPSSLTGLSALSKFGLAAFPFVGGVYGLSTLANATQMQAQREVAARGLFENAVQPNGSRVNVYDSTMSRFNRYADRVGLNINDTMPSFQGFMASAMPTLGTETSQNIFEAFSSFGTVRGATADSMKRALVAIQQMAAKGKIGAEELRQQLGDAQGFGEMQQLFAQAYQMFTTKTNNPNDSRLLKGSKSTAALADAMQKGKVMASDILPIVAQLANQISAPTIDAASRTSTAERNRFENAQSRFSRDFALNGGDRGWAELWRTLTTLTDRAATNAKTMGYYFELTANYASLALLYTQQFVDLFSENADTDNIFKNIFDKETLENAKGIGADIKSIFESFSSMQAGGSQLKGMLQDAIALGRMLTGIGAQIGALLSGDWAAAKQHGNDAYRAMIDLFVPKGSPMYGDMRNLADANRSAPSTPSFYNYANQPPANIASVPQASPLTALAGANVRNNQSITVQNNVTVQKPEDVSTAIQQATQGAILGGQVDPFFFTSPNKGAFPNSGQ